MGAHEGVQRIPCFDRVFGAVEWVYKAVEACLDKGKPT